MPFSGFSADSLQFLGELADHNDRVWFAENRERYERELLGRERDFVDAVGASFAALDQRVQAVPAVDRSIFRINRDTRFSRDKSPYKTYADLWFWVGDDRKSAPGYFLRLVPGSVMIGGGAHQMTPGQIAQFRLAVDDAMHGPWLERVLEDLQAEGFEIDGRARRCRGGSRRNTGAPSCSSTSTCTRSAPSHRRPPSSPVRSSSTGAWSGSHGSSHS